MKTLKNKNNGLELLRMFLCFWVVLFHSLRISDSNLILNFKKKMFHVPSFFFISFYFLFPIIQNRNIDRMALRLERLLIPYIFWPLITWCMSNLFFLIFKKSRFDRLLTLYELLKQLIIGRKFYGQFWFLFNLLFFTIIFFILSILLEENNLLQITKTIAIISYILQYSTYNYIFFDNYRECISHSIGHFVETFPIAITAFLLYSYDIPNKLKKVRNKTIFYCILGNYFIYKYKIFMDITIYGRKYNYNGFDKNIFALLSFIGFYLIPIDFLNSNKLNLFIKLATNYTQGIYCVHTTIAYYATKLFHLKRNLYGCIIIYILSYLISFLGTKISFNTRIKFLFI